jgi:hypothetical protein
MSKPTNNTDRAGRLEGAIEIVILLAVAAMAGAASFTHVHDWTMRYSPPGTGNWFGWANAMVSELIPLAAGLEARRRSRIYAHAGAYPIALIIGAVALSLTGQFSEATHTFFGWVVAAIPAVGFMALVKLVISRPSAPPAEDGNRETELLARITELETALAAPPAPSTPDTTPAGNVPADVPAASLVDAAPLSHLLPTARFAVTNHEATTGRTITAPELAARMSVTPDVAGRLLTLFDLPEPKPAVTAGINGTSHRGEG